jgi:glycosyltransferase involved in cell wall biosynthesis
MAKHMTQRIIFVWQQFGPYHMDRCEAVAQYLGSRFEVIGVEIASSGAVYAWEKSGAGVSFGKETIFPGRSYEELGFVARLFGLIRHCFRARAKHVFLCNYEHPHIFLLAASLRLLGRRVFVMQESKLDDRQRFVLRELAKALLYLPYNGVLAGGARTLSYMQFLGFREENVFEGYDTVSVQRIRHLAGVAPAPDGVPYDQRHFTIIARFIPKKNLNMAIAAYDGYRGLVGNNARELHLCGAGELEESLRRDVEKRRLEGVRFLGFLQADGVARVLASTLALILPSTEEQWGLVVNEGLAMGVPILCSDNVGARDTLVRAGLNGYVFQPDCPEGLAYLMHRLANDEAEWRSFAQASAALAAKGDTKQFAEAVAAAVGIAIDG